MAATDGPYAETWYGQQLDRLHREAPAGSKTSPHDALRHLPTESILEIVNITFENYDARIKQLAERCIDDGNMDTLHAVIKAHQAIMKQFELFPKDYFLDMASTIGDYFIRKKEKELGIESLARAEIYTPELPAPPVSGPPIPCTVFSWLNNLDDSTSEPPPHLEPSMGESTTTMPEDPTPKPRANTHSPQRQRHPRKVKMDSVPYNRPEALPSTRQSVAKRLGRDRKTATKESIPAYAHVEITYQTGTKRRRDGDAVISSENAHVTQKRRKVAKPATRSKT